VTRGDGGKPRAPTAPKPASALSPRDHAVVELVERFRQLSAAHVRALLFPELASQTPLDRTLRRLVERKYLARLERLVGGAGGGSGQYVYQLGRQGWRLLGKSGNYFPYRAVNLHTLAIADCYVALKAEEAKGMVEVMKFVTEPGCHLSVSGISLTPDAYVEIGNRAQRMRYRYFVEVDRGTESAAKIQEKCQRYWRAYQRWDEAFFPQVLFVVPDERRRFEVERVVADGPSDEARSIYITKVATTILFGDNCPAADRTSTTTV